MATMTGSEALIQSLKRHQVDTIFSLVGNQLAAFYNAWIEHPELREVGVRHEQAASYMAMGYAWASGHPGVCMTVSGPGALNAATGMGTAAAGSIPVLLISGQVTSSAFCRDRRLVHQLDPQSEMFGHMLKGSRVVRRLEDIPEAVEEAFHVMTSGVPGPYELEFLMDILSAKGDVQFPEPLHPSPVADADQALLERVAQEISQARRPAILAGFGVVQAEATEELRALAELLQAPVYTSFKGKGALPDDHPQCLGATGDSGGTTSPVDPDADLFLALGTRMSAWTKGSRTLPPGKRVIQIDLDPARIGACYPVEIGVVGEVRRTLGQLLDRLRAIPQVQRAPHDWPAMKQERIEAMRRAAPESVPLLEGLRRVLPRNAIVVADVTALGGWSGVALDTYEPRTYINPTYFASLGHGFPTAMGAKVAFPDRAVIDISGDGAFLFNSQELETACRYGIPVVAIIIDDSGFGTIKELQLEQYGRCKGHEFNNPDWVKLAEAYGAHGFAVKNLEDIPHAVEQALSLKGPSLVVAKHPTLPSYALNARPGG